MATLDKVPEDSPGEKSSPVEQRNAADTAQPRQLEQQLQSPSDAGAHVVAQVSM
jgi:hypothetical protein